MEGVCGGRGVWEVEWAVLRFKGGSKILLGYPINRCVLGVDATIITHSSDP